MSLIQVADSVRLRHIKKCADFELAIQSAKSDVLGLKVGDEFVGAHPAATAKGYVHNTMLFDIYVSTYIANMPELYVTAYTNIIVQIGDSI